MAAPNIEISTNPTSTGNNTSGVRIGETTSQVVGFYGETGSAQHSTTGNVAGFAAGAGTASKSDSVWTGGVGSTAYTVGDVVRALKNLGIMAE